jgi:hypothetical protein
MGPQLDIRSPGSFADVLQGDPEAWAIRISARWRMGVEAIIATGRLLNEAKAVLKHGGFGAVLKQLPFGERQAQMLMAIANHPIASNPQYIALLPPSWGTIYDATRLPLPVFERAAAEGIIRPDMERADIARLLPRPATIPEPAERGDPDQNAAGGPLERPSMAAGQSGDQEAGETTEAGASGSLSPALLAPGDPASVEGADGDDQPHAPPASLPGGGLAIAHRRVEPEGLDYFPTPPFATRALVEHVLAHLRRDKQCKLQKAWEPACGKGHMAEPLKEYFREVLATDIEDRGYQESIADFLACDHPQNSDWIITNPPFGHKTEKFILKALSLDVTGVAMFTRLQMLEGTGRYERIYKDRPPSLVAFFSERVPIHKGRWVVNGDTMTAYAWLLWIKGMEPQPPFWIPPGCRAALSKPEDATRLGGVYEDDDGNEAPAAETAE